MAAAAEEDAWDVVSFSAVSVVESAAAHRPARLLSQHGPFWVYPIGFAVCMAIVTSSELRRSRGIRQSVS